MTNTDDVKSKLRKLHARLIDANNGYEEGVSRTDDKTVERTFRQIMQMRAQHITEIDRLLREIGENPDSDGSWMTPVHETIMTVRSWIGALDQSVLESVASGEEQIADLTAKTAEAAADLPDIRSSLVRQHAEITHRIKAMRQTEGVA